MPLDDLDDFEFERSPHEPEEWDPEAEFRDSDSEWPTIPDVSTEEADAPTDVVRTFWIVVVVVNVAVLFVALGPMLIYFWGDWRSGLLLIVGGLVLFGLAYRRTRAFLREDPEDDGPAEGEGPGDAGSAAADEAPATRATGAETDSTPRSEPVDRNDSSSNP